MPDQQASQDPSEPADKSAPAQAETIETVTKQQYKVAPASQSNTSQNQSDTKELAREIHWVEKATLFSQIGLGIIGIVALIIYGSQLSTMNGQLDVMRQQLGEMKSSGQSATGQTWAAIDNMNWMARTMDGSLKESQVARGTSEKQSKAALDASILVARTDQRCWIGLQGIHYTIDAGKVIESTIVFTNTGKTPAVNLRTRATMKPVPVGDAPDFQHIYSIVPQNHSPVAPNASIFTNPKDHSNIPLAQDEVDAIKQGAAVVYIYGRIDYEDIFHVDHWISFCYSANTDLVNSSACKEHNEIDNNPEYPLGRQPVTPLQQ